MRLGRAFLCFLFAVSGSADLDTNVRYFETLESDDLHVTSITKRSADGKLSRTKHIRFRTLGREFNLVLYPGSSVLSSKFRAVTVDKHGKNEPFYINRNDFYSGHLAENSSVEVTAHFEEGVLSSSIHFHNDTYVVEPAWRHRKPSENFTMISYRGSDVNWDEILPFDPKTGKRTKLKDGIRLPEGSAYNTQQAYGQNATYAGGDSRHKRGAVEKNTCPLLVVADYYFFKNMGNNKRQISASFIISTIQKVNVHYKRTVFDADNGFYDMGFQIDEMKIYVQFTNKRGHFNSDINWGYNRKLYAFSRSPTNNRFCLAHLFTSYAMSDNVLGLAFIAPENLNSAGGICTVDTQLEGAKAYPRTGWSSTLNSRGLPVLSLQHELVVTHVWRFGNSRFVSLLLMCYGLTLDFVSLLLMCYGLTLDFVSLLLMCYGLTLDFVSLLLMCYGLTLDFVSLLLMCYGLTLDFVSLLLMCYGLTLDFVSLLLMCYGLTLDFVSLLLMCYGLTLDFVSLLLMCYGLTLDFVSLLLMCYGLWTLFLFS
ncbi:ADAM 17-like protease [Littorina saxatilis]|uniref:ADAM 17-like protease n=1 Tax=Littorina saxatilis TaxID=31220 RepID=UPI0038B5B1D9